MDLLKPFIVFLIALFLGTVVTGFVGQAIPGIGSGILGFIVGGAIIFLYTCSWREG